MEVRRRRVLFCDHLRPRRSRAIPEGSVELRKGDEQPYRFGRLREFASREKPNEQTDQTRFFREALRVVDYRPDATTDLDRKTVSRKYFQASYVLQPEHQRHEHNFRRLSFDSRRFRRKANYFEAKKQRLCEARSFASETVLPRGGRSGKGENK